MATMTQLTEAVVAQLDCDTYEKCLDILADVAKHGADAGFPNFTNYCETTDFFKANQQLIVDAIEEQAQSFGISPMDYVASWRCLRGYDYTREIGHCLYGDVGDHNDDFLAANAMAWFALEFAAMEVCDADCDVANC